MEIDVDRPEIFPPGTEVAVYPPGSAPDRERAPTGKAIGESQVIGGEEVENEAEEMETVVDETVSEFTVEVSAKGIYLVAGKVDGQWRYLEVIAGVLGSSLLPPARFPSHSAH